MGSTPCCARPSCRGTRLSPALHRLRGPYATRGDLVTGRPVLLTEHGIYTNERRVEITLADWLQEDAVQNLSIDRRYRDLRDLWIDTFTSFSRACYAACSTDRHALRRQHAAAAAGRRGPRARITVIPNGIELAERRRRERADAPPDGGAHRARGPIKDIKTFLRACGDPARLRARRAGVDSRAARRGPGLRRRVPELAALLDLDATVEFKGKVALEDYYPQIDVLVLTSVSEAQPLVILEAAAHGHPVGGHRRRRVPRDDPGPLRREPGARRGRRGDAARQSGGHGARAPWLLTDAEAYERCGHAARERVRRYYNKARSRHGAIAISIEHIAMDGVLVEA